MDKKTGNRVVLIGVLLAIGLLMVGAMAIVSPGIRASGTSKEGTTFVDGAQSQDGSVAPEDSTKFSVSVDKNGNIRIEGENAGTDIGDVDASNSETQSSQQVTDNKEIDKLIEVVKRNGKMHEFAKGDPLINELIENLNKGNYGVSKASTSEPAGGIIFSKLQIDSGGNCYWVDVIIALDTESAAAQALTGGEAEVAQVGAIFTETTCRGVGLEPADGLK